VSACYCLRANLMEPRHLDRMNGFHALLDPRLHTFDFGAAKSFFLLSAVLQTVAARDADPSHEERSALLAIDLLKHMREVIWPRILLSNYRSVQICQACMIWGTFAPSTDISDDDPSWFMFGHARESKIVARDTGCLRLVEVRIAVELGLQRNFRQPDSSNTRLRLLVRDAERCWMTCLLADRRFVNKRL
jgi:hypothetical protein